MDATGALNPLVLNADAVKALPVQTIGDIPGIRHRVLWHSDDAMVGVMTVQAGHRLGAHTHERNHHHLFVLEGRLHILGEVLGPGSYVHIPSGVEHDIDATETSGGTIYYTYIGPD